jgi:NADH-quinone oxidoreductase subunit G
MRGDGALKDLMAALGSPNLDCRQDGAKLDAGAAPLSLQHHHRRHRGGRRLPLIGTNPRHEAPMVNARMRKRWLQGGFRSAASAPST